MASETPPPLNIHPLPTTYLPAQPPTPEPYAPHRDAQTPIVIDNGSTTLRWGFGTSDTPALGPERGCQVQGAQDEQAAAALRRGDRCGERRTGAGADAVGGRRAAELRCAGESAALSSWAC